jgi:hypothetical protein
MSATTLIQRCQGGGERAPELYTDIRAAERAAAEGTRTESTRALARTDAFRKSWWAQPTIQPETAFSRFPRARRADLKCSKGSRAVGRRP